MPDREALAEEAVKARSAAYAPYSGYRVGAAAQDERGRIFAGCNVENVSYPVGLCAERVAIGSLIAAGGQKVVAIAIATHDGGTPCGLCLQTLLEFSNLDHTLIQTLDEAHNRREYSLRDLLPHGFSSKDVMRENDSTR